MRAGGELLALFVWMAPHTPIISNMRIIISYKRGAQFRMRKKRGRPTRKRWCCFRLMVLVD
jgi:hypothetical protein